MKKKSIYVILAILLLAASGCMIAAFAGSDDSDDSTPTVTFDASKFKGNEGDPGAEVAFTVENTTRFEDNEYYDLFSEFKNMMPGDSRESSFDLNVKFGNRTKLVRIYLTAEWNDDIGSDDDSGKPYNDDYEKMMKAFAKMITVSLNGKDYTGTLNEIGSDEENSQSILLGEFSSPENRKIYLKCDFPVEAGNEFANMAAELGWKFTAEVVDKSEPGGGGGGGQPKPELNTYDHFAYIVGYPDGTVRPEASITRAEAVTVFFRQLTEESRNMYWSNENNFSDVDSSDWYNNAISTLVDAGVITGYPDGTFRPDNPITRAEMAKIISLFAKLDRTGGDFKDVEGHWAEAYIGLAAGNDWINGYPDGTFKPDKQISRAETVTMVNRVLERVPAEESRLLPRSGMQVYPDNEPGAWYYIAMQEATNSHNYSRVSKGSRAADAGNADEKWIGARPNYDWTLLEK